jgi:hypothetical protein
VRPEKTGRSCDKNLSRHHLQPFFHWFAVPSTVFVDEQASSTAAAVRFRERKNYLADDSEAGSRTGYAAGRPMLR